MSCRTDGSRCATCGDVADRARIVAIDGADATVDFEDGERATVAVDLVPGIAPGDVVLVHQGVAIGVHREETPVDMNA